MYLQHNTNGQESISTKKGHEGCKSRLKISSYHSNLLTTLLETNSIKTKTNLAWREISNFLKIYFYSGFYIYADRLRRWSIFQGPGPKILGGPGPTRAPPSRPPWERVYEMSMTFGTPFDTSVKTLQNRVYEMSGCTSCLQTICPGIPIVWGRYVRVYELSLDQMSKQTKCQGVRNVMGVPIVLLPKQPSNRQ